MGLMEVIVGDDYVIWRVIREVMIQLSHSAKTTLIFRTTYNTITPPHREQRYRLHVLFPSNHSCYSIRVS
jgi:hypothetical protein